VEPSVTFPVDTFGGTKKDAHSIPFLIFLVANSPLHTVYFRIISGWRLVGLAGDTRRHYAGFGGFSKDAMDVIDMVNDGDEER